MLCTSHPISRFLSHPTLKHHNAASVYGLLNDEDLSCSQRSASTRSMNDFRVIRLAGDDGNLTKESFIKILKSSDFFMKAFDKNKDGIVTEVTWWMLIKFMSQMNWQCKLTSIQNLWDKFCAAEQGLNLIFWNFTFNIFLLFPPSAFYPHWSCKICHLQRCWTPLPCRPN